MYNLIEPKRRLIVFVRVLQAAKEMAASSTSSKKEEEKLKRENRLYKVREPLSLL